MRWSLANTIDIIDIMSNWFFEEQVPGLRLSFKVKRKIAKEKSKFQSIEIIETVSHGRLLALDNMIMLTELDEFIYHEMLAHIPLFASSDPKRVLVVGGGDGGTVRECLKHDSVSAIDLCELDEKVINMSKQYLPFTGKSLNHKKVNIYVEDGFIFLENNTRKYDVILVDSMDPKGEAKKLFGKQFLTLARDNLQPHGILCAQSESPFFYASTSKQMLRILSSLFEHVSFYCAPIPTYPFGYWSFVIASNSPIQFQRDRYLKQQSAMRFKYYNDAIHAACFQLPEFFRASLYGKRA